MVVVCEESRHVSGLKWFRVQDCGLRCVGMSRVEVLAIAQAPTTPSELLYPLRLLREMQAGRIKSTP